MSQVAPVTVVGIGQGGCLELSAKAMHAISKAQVLVGGRRQLAFFPEFSGEIIVLEKGLMATIERVRELAEDHNICVLASGDPLFFGIGKLLAKKIGPEHVQVISSPSSVQLAFAKLGLNWDDACLLSAHGRALAGLSAKIDGEHKVALLTCPENCPARIATHLLEYGQQGWSAHLCQGLGGADEALHSFSTLKELAQSKQEYGLNVLILLRDAEQARARPVLGAFPESAFAKKMPKKGLITKTEVRVMALSMMQITRSSVVWDIGAGSGSVAIEAARLATHGQVHAVETELEGVGYCQENARNFGVDNVTVHHARAPEGLDALPAPGAVFIGGTKGGMPAIVKLCLDRLLPGGRLVLSAVTLENVSLAYGLFKELGYSPEVSLVQVSRGAPLAHYTRYDAQNPIHLFALTKKEEASA